MISHWACLGGPSGYHGSQDPRMMWRPQKSLPLNPPGATRTGGGSKGAAFGILQKNWEHGLWMSLGSDFEENEDFLGGKRWGFQWFWIILDGRYTYYVESQWQICWDFRDLGGLHDLNISCPLNRRVPAQTEVRRWRTWVACAIRCCHEISIECAKSRNKYWRILDGGDTQWFGGNME